MADPNNENPRASGGNTRRTVASLAEDVDANTERLFAIEDSNNRMAAEVTSLTVEMSTLKGELKASIEAQTEALSAMRNLLAESMGAQRPAPSQETSFRLVTPPLDTHMRSSSEQVVSLKDELVYQKHVHAMLKDARIMGPRDLRFPVVKSNWEQATQRLPKHMLPSLVVLAFGGRAEMLYKQAESNLTLKPDASVEERWKWAEQEFWSTQIQDSILDEYQARLYQYGEPLRGYHDALSSLGAALGVGERQLKADFVRGLPSHVQQIARLHMGQQSYQGLVIQLEKEFGSALERPQQIQRAGLVFPRARVNLLEEGDNAAFGKGGESVPIDINSLMENLDRITRILEQRVGGTQNLDRVVCWRCQQTGHYASECKAAVSTVAPPSLPGKPSPNGQPPNRV